MTQEEPESECNPQDLCAGCKCKYAYAQPEQEPVACIYKGYLYMAHEFQSGQVPVDSQPLYTTQPQRTWVGLTDDEISELSKGHIVRSTYARAIEAKLKERNDHSI
jgi:hypothetical protein